MRWKVELVAQNVATITYDTLLSGANIDLAAVVQLVVNVQPLVAAKLSTGSGH